MGGMVVAGIYFAIAMRNLNPTSPAQPVQEHALEEGVALTKVRSDSVEAPVVDVVEAQAASA